MRAVRSIAGAPTLVEVDEPSGDWPVLQVGSTSIGGSDLSLLPFGLPVADASLVEPLAVCWHALRRASAARGERVLVVGGGSVGLLMVAAARAMGLQVDLEARHSHQKAAEAFRVAADRAAGTIKVALQP